MIIVPFRRQFIMKSGSAGNATRIYTEKYYIFVLEFSQNRHFVSSIFHKLYCIRNAIRIYYNTNCNYSSADVYLNPSLPPLEATRASTLTHHRAHRVCVLVEKYEIKYFFFFLRRDCI